MKAQTQLLPLLLDLLQTLHRMQLLAAPAAAAMQVVVLLVVLALLS
jgi:hypothetical protein